MAARVDTGRGDPLRRVERYASEQIPVTPPAATAGDVLRRLRTEEFESVHEVAVCENNRLLGIVAIKALLRAEDETPLREIMDPEPPVVAPGFNRERAAWKAVQHGETSLAVVDENGAFRGLVPPHRLLGVLLHEHDEDMARLGGFLRGAEEARTSAEEDIPRRFFHRLPWLAVGLVGALLAAAMLDRFEAQLEDHILLAFFIPGIVYMADATGTQTEFLVVRGLSLGVVLRRVMVKEIVTGALVGLALALAFFPLGALAWGDTEVAVVVSITLFAVALMATLIGVVLPWLLARLESDPAFGSGPLAAVVQHLLAIIIYVAVALLIIG
jgi:magnesium transporter